MHNHSYTMTRPISISPLPNIRIWKIKHVYKTLDRYYFVIQYTHSAYLQFSLTEIHLDSDGAYYS